MPEIFELTWMLSCVTGKGLMNRAHAYKAARDRNRSRRRGPRRGVNMGLFNYPVLMAADILIMAADVVPVGKDQVQHVEYARDIAEQLQPRLRRALLPHAAPRPSPPTTTARAPCPGSTGGR